MTSQSKSDFRRIQDAIRMLARDDRATLLTTKLHDNPAVVDATLTLIEDLCQVIREQEDLVREEAIDVYGPRVCN